MRPPERHNPTHCPQRPTARRAVAAVIFVAALLVISTLVLWVFQVTAVGAKGALGSLSTNAAFYAAESGIEFALLELKNGSDLDGDGTVGSISYDGNDSNDPGLDIGTFHVQYASNQLTSAGTWQQCTRIVEATMQ